MSMLSSLASAYDRLAERGEVPSFGYSSQRIGFLISLKDDGSPAHLPTSLLSEQTTRRIAPFMIVPQPVTRTSGIAPNFLWDKTAYVLGVTAGMGRRVEEEHAAFVGFHERVLAETNDAGLLALLRFLRWWNPEQFQALGWPDDMKDQNVAFGLESDRRKNIRIHDRSAARELWARLAMNAVGREAICLVSGERMPVARLHPAIKGVWGSQTSGARIVSFNLDAFESYGHEQGDNAPVSEVTAFAYTTALNKFLESGSKNRIQIGDSSTVFWADGSNAERAESIFTAFWEGSHEDISSEVDEHTEAQKVRTILDGLRKGKPLGDLDPALQQGVRFYVLGLAPNAARLSVRFWLEDEFGVIAERFRRFANEMRVEPPPRGPNPPLWRYLIETAALGKRENVPPNLAGDWLRSILTGHNYPLTLFSTIQMRLRADRNINAFRVAMLKAVLMRNFKMEVPVAFDPEFSDKGYLLGRLFAVYERVQIAALGHNVNATIKDKFYGAASAQPRKVFHLLESGSANHLSKVGKQNPGYRVVLEKQIGAIMNMMTPADDPFPAFLSSEQQALFGVGYHHQRSEFFRPRETAPSTESEEIAT